MFCNPVWMFHLLWSNWSRTCRSDPRLTHQENQTRLGGSQFRKLGPSKIPEMSIEFLRTRVWDQNYVSRKNGRVLSIVPKKYKNQWVNSLEFWPMPTKADSLLKPVLHLTSQKNQSANCSSRRVWKHQQVVWLSVFKSYQTNKRAIQLIVTGWSEWLVQLWLWPRNKHITLSQLLTQLAQGVWVMEHTWSNCKWPQTTIGQSFLVRLRAHPLCSRSRGAENLAKWDPSEAHHYLARSIRETWVC